MLGAFTSELDRIAPKFEIQGSQIQMLRTPSEFYETLKVGSIGKLGTGKCADGSRPRY
jgi:CDP-diacylglycerol--glycerol-3-phosphate 3-phosphatidyltransferase